jgi:hypothetical protein
MNVMEKLSSGNMGEKGDAIDQRFDQRIRHNIMIFKIFQALMNRLRNNPLSPPAYPISPVTDRYSCKLRSYLSLPQGYTATPAPEPSAGQAAPGLSMQIPDHRQRRDPSLTGAGRYQAFADCHAATTPASLSAGITGSQRRESESHRPVPRLNIPQRVGVKVEYC